MWKAIPHESLSTSLINSFYCCFWLFLFSLFQPLLGLLETLVQNFILFRSCIIPARLKGLFSAISLDHQYLGFLLVCLVLLDMLASQTCSTISMRPRTASFRVSSFFVQPILFMALLLLEMLDLSQFLDSPWFLTNLIALYLLKLYFSFFYIICNIIMVTKRDLIKKLPISNIPSSFHACQDLINYWSGAISSKGVFASVVTCDHQIQSCDHLTD